MTLTPLAAPTLLDPRVSFLLSAAERHAVEALWHLAERLLGIMCHAREVILAQIKLAWWCDTVARLADGSNDLPHGEPLIAALGCHWAGRSDLQKLTEAAQIMFDTENLDKRHIAGADFGRCLFSLTRRCAGAGTPSTGTTEISGADGADGAEGAAWGLVRLALMQEERLDAARLFALADAAALHGKGAHGIERILYMLDLWAGMIACGGGARRLIRESAILARAGIFGR